MKNLYPFILVLIALLSAIITIFIMLGISKFIKIPKNIDFIIFIIIANSICFIFIKIWLNLKSK